MSEQSTDDTERVDYDEMSSAFVREEIHRDGILAEVEAVRSASDDKRDGDARYTLEVRVRSVESDTDRSGDSQ